jgi:YVTN family beta-propeller protein
MSPKSLALTLLVVAGCALQPAGPAVGPANRVYVANESSGTVSMIDAGTMQVVGTVGLGSPGTHDLVLTRDGKTLFATNLATGRLSLIDTTQGAVVASLTTGNRCHSVALTNDERHLWVVNIGDNNISIVDVSSLRILGTIPVGKMPGHIRFSKDGQYAYVTLQGEDSVEVVEVGSHRTLTKIPAGKTPHYLLPSPDGRYMWGGGTGGDDVYVIDVATNQRVAALKVGLKPQHLAFGFRGMVGPLAYVVTETQNEVVVVNADPRELKVLDRIPVGAAPNGVGADRTGTRLFVANQLGNSVSVIDTGTGRAIATIPVGIKPVGVVVSF